MDELAPFEVFDGSAWEAGLLKSILEDNETECILQDSSPQHWNIYPTSTTSVKVFVAFKDFDKATEIVKEFSSNMQKENSSEPEQ